MAPKKEQSQRKVLNLTIPRLCSGELRYKKVAEVLGVHERTAQRVVKKQRVTGTTKDRPRSGRPSSLTTALLERINRYTHNNLTASLKAISAAINGEVEPNIINRALTKMGYTLHSPRVKP